MKRLAGTSTVRSDPRACRCAVGARGQPALQKERHTGLHRDRQWDVPVCVTGTLTGLGNEDLLIETTVSGFAVYQCQNRGGTIAPGQNKVLEGPVTEPTVVPAGEIKNGNVTFTAGATLTADPTVSAAVAGCPNDNWVGINPTLTITSIMLEISQGDTFIYCGAVSDPAGLTGAVRFPARSNC